MEVNYTPVPNGLLELLYGGELTLSETRILPWFIRETIGWKKRRMTGNLSVEKGGRLLSKETGLARQAARDGLQHLTDKKLITITNGIRGRAIISPGSSLVKILDQSLDQKVVQSEQSEQPTGPESSPVTGLESSPRSKKGK